MAEYMFPNVAYRATVYRTGAKTYLILYLSLENSTTEITLIKGRLGYDNVNTSIQEFNAALEARYAFLAKGFQAMASMALKKRYKVRFSVN